MFLVKFLIVVQFLHSQTQDENPYWIHLSKVLPKTTGLAEDKPAALADNIIFCYEHLKDIVENVVQFENINIRRLSINHLYLAKEISWCFQYFRKPKSLWKKV